MKLSSLYLILFFFFLSTTQSHSVETWNSGQTTCYDETGSVIDCTGTGQDGDIQAGVNWPLPRFMDNGDGSITDKLTGLTWLKNANCFGLKSWSNALANCNNLSSGSCGLSDGSTAGDWRLPNRKELLSLIDYSQGSPALPQVHPFQDVQSSVSAAYWSSTTWRAEESYAWFLGMYTGHWDHYFKWGEFYVWPVRSSINIDIDGDGIPNNLDLDDDNDGIPDDWEDLYEGLDPYVNDADEDLDMDGITNYYEYMNNRNPVLQDQIKPIDIRVTVGNEKLYLSWILNLNIPNVTFEIEWGETNGTKQRDLVDNTNVVFKDLIIGTEYEILVIAVINGNEYPADSTVKVRVPAPILRINDTIHHSPILLIPGTGGKATAWDYNPGPNNLSVDMRRHLEDFGFTFGGELLDDYSWRTDIGYGTFNHKGDFYTCNYLNPCDSIIDNYWPTKNFVDAIRSARKDHAKVTLVGQSLGGLRARAYLQKKDRDLGDRLVTNKIERLITIGTPHLGVLSDHDNYEVSLPEPFFDTNHNGQWDSDEAFEDVNGNLVYDNVDIRGAWKILLGNADESEETFFWPITKEYRFNGGYINDPLRYNSGLVESRGHDALRFLVKNLRDLNGWDFTGQALMVDVIEDSHFLTDLNFFTYGDSENDRFNPLPEIDYRYLIGCKPTGYLHWVFWAKYFNEGFDAKWFNDFLYGDDYFSGGGDGFISVRSQNFEPWHPTSHNVKAIFREGENHSSELSDYIGLLEALDVEILRIIAKCPVDIKVESPSGEIQSKEYANIFGARYSEADVDDDGEVDKFIEIPFPEQGNYSITVTPMPGSDPGETYSLELEQGGIVTVIKQDEPISSLNGTPQIISINAAPIANAGPDQIVRQDESGTTEITLNGSGSSDAGSSVGTNDDIVSFEWYIGGNKIGDGETIDVDLELGEHQIKLIVTDQGGLIDEDRLFVTVALPGDFDLDGNVNSEDLAIFTKYFGCTDCTDGNWWLGDLDKDGDVDAFDLVKLIQAFGFP